jgi:hypothetical protein
VPKRVKVETGQYFKSIVGIYLVEEKKRIGINVIAVKGPVDSI